MFVDRDRRAMTGRWFTGGYDEIGLDVTVGLADGGAVVSGVYPPAMRVGATGETVRIYGLDLSATQTEVDLGPGVDARVTRASANVLEVAVTVAADAPVGTRDLFVGRQTLLDAFAVFDRYDHVRVTPTKGMARVGGGAFPKQFQQFEARVYHNGSDGRPRTDDDLDLGQVDVDWTLEEYAVTYRDDDVAFVGQLGADGLFMPAVDGPNPDRHNGGNNIGDVWVVATLRRDAAGGELTRPLRARAHLLVTVPRYLRRDADPTGGEADR